MTEINPADCKPGEMYEGTVRGERRVLVRRDDDFEMQWESLSEVHDHEDVSSLVRLVPASTAPAVSREDVEKAEIEKVLDQTLEKLVHGDYIPGPAADAVWSLLSGDDPAVFVVRESDIAAVEVERDGSGGWIADGSDRGGADASASQLRDEDIPMLRCYLAQSEAIARAIEAGQDTDPVEEKARELARAGGIDFDEQEPRGVEMLIGMARHVLGQEADQ